MTDVSRIALLGKSAFYLRDEILKILRKGLKPQKIVLDWSKNYSSKSSLSITFRRRFTVTTLNNIYAVVAIMSLFPPGVIVIEQWSCREKAYLNVNQNISDPLWATKEMTPQENAFYVVLGLTLSLLVKIWSHH